MIGLEGDHGGVTVRARQQGVERCFDADVAIHGAGRVPELDDLELDVAGVKLEKHGVVVNEYLQSVSNAAVYAGGDAAASGPPLTPKADHDVAVLVTNLLEGNRRAVNYEGMASAAFTIPPLASAGLTEEAARAAGMSFRTSWKETSGNFNTRRVGETASGFKVLVEQGTGRILGAHVLGPNAAEVINLFATTIRLRIPAGDLKEVPFAYPSCCNRTFGLHRRQLPSGTWLAGQEVPSWRRKFLPRSGSTSMRFQAGSARTVEPTPRRTYSAACGRERSALRDC